MEYAPILDPAAYTSKSEPRRRLALAAASVLQAIAANAVTLSRAIGVVESSGTGDGSDAVAAVELGRLKVVSAMLAAHPMRDQLLMELLEQLKQVKKFGELDGGSVKDYAEPVCHLIQSGRVELFAGRAARAT